METTVNNKLSVILTGATGMVGEGVLLECLANQHVEQVLIINRKPSGYSHPKLKEIIHANFFKLDDIQHELSGYNACYFCLGVSSVGMKEDEYTRLTYDLTMNFAQTLVALNRDMTFCYMSGKSTDSTEKERLMWARVKGKTENDLMKLPFKAVYAFRPGMMLRTLGQRNVLSAYKYLNWMLPTLIKLFPNYVHTIKQVGQAMINVSMKSSDKKVLEVKDIVSIANQ